MCLITLHCACGATQSTFPLPLSAFPLTLSMFLKPRITTVVVFGICISCRSGILKHVDENKCVSERGSERGRDKGKRSERPKSRRYQCRRRTHLCHFFGVDFVSRTEEKQNHQLIQLWSYACHTKKTPGSSQRLGLAFGLLFSLFDADSLSMSFQRTIHQAHGLNNARALFSV